MLTEPEAADCDKLFANLGSSRPGGVSEALLGLPDTDRMGLAQWASEESWLLTDVDETRRNRERQKESGLSEGRASLRQTGEPREHKYHEIRQSLMLDMTPPSGASVWGLVSMFA